MGTGALTTFNKVHLRINMQEGSQESLNFLRALTDLEPTADLLATPAIENILLFKKVNLRRIYMVYTGLYLGYLICLYVRAYFSYEPTFLIYWAYIQIVFEII